MHEENPICVAQPYWYDTNGSAIPSVMLGLKGKVTNSVSNELFGKVLIIAQKATKPYIVHNEIDYCKSRRESYHLREFVC